MPEQNPSVDPRFTASQIKPGLVINDRYKLLKQIGYRASVCLHIEFDWSDKGKTKTRAALAQALQESGQVLRRWLATGT